MHLHLLPGLDDGPATLDESLEHAERLVAGGVTDAVATPHVGHPAFPVPIHEIPARTAALQRALGAAGLPLRLRPGGEIHAGAADGLTDAQLSHVAQGGRRGRWVLLEPPFTGIGQRFVESVGRMRARGIGVLVAHPERSAGFLDGGFEALRPELGPGVMLQLNVCSLLGHHGTEPLDGARWLLRHDLADVMASDGHGGRRTQTLARGYEAAIEAGVAARRARELTRDVPRFLAERGMPGVRRQAWTPSDSHSA